MRAIYPLCSATVEINSQVSGSSLCWYTALPNSDRCEIHSNVRIPFDFNTGAALLKKLFELFEVV